MEYKNKIVKQENVDPRKLKANPNNFREHPMTQSKAMIGSLEELGWISGVVVNINTGNLIDGHLRVILILWEQIGSLMVRRCLLIYIHRLDLQHP